MVKSGFEKVEELYVGNLSKYSFIKGFMDLVILSV
jgi:hypothetical protein